MRAFSRCTAGSRELGAGAFGIGSETKRSPGELVQPASRTASTAAMPSVRVTLIVDCPPIDPPTLRYLMTSICSGADASIMGPRRCSTQPRTLILRPSSSFGSMFRRREISPMPLGDDDRKILGPPPSEIDIYCGAVLPHRQDLALNEGELTPNSRNAANIV